MKKGFTLIEILVVIAIVGVLSAIAIHVWNAPEGKPQTEQEYCEAWGDVEISGIPVKCLKYFGFDKSQITIIK